VTAATPADQRRLLDLQQVDTAIRQLEHRRSNLPEQRALDENADTLSRIAGDYATNTERLERLQAQIKRHENEIATVDSRRKSEEGRMYSGLITSEKELEALRHELSSLRNRKSDLEDALLELMEQCEDTDGLVTSLKERHAELTASVAELTTARDTAATDIDAELEQRRAERAAIAADIPAAVLSVYEGLVQRKQGLGAAALQGRTCSGCRLELTAIEMEELRETARDRLSLCAQCGRILVP
jgi:uncharacterized protein